MTTYTPEQKRKKQNCYPGFFEVGCACGVAFALKLVSLARNRLNFGV
jgi:hypothetical protein